MQILSQKILMNYFNQQWGINYQIYFLDHIQKRCGELILKIFLLELTRLPVRTNKDTRYFNDDFQALPKLGYTKMIENMFSHENINISLSQPFDRRMEINYDYIFLCLPIDKYFNYKYGVLPYRSIKFENRLEKIDRLSAPVINFTDESKYTRKTQWSLFPNSYNKESTFKTITYEIPCSMELNPNEYYYPSSY